ncbi:hypothetical protein SAMN04487967_0716 [Natronorubrum sediminis]|uniref:Uncharacterized protein n=1 Tax=Natronorubrum sediminis TaxID=640943 RepID=A0A1H6FMX2_9EURY|nr:hypothetical protein [Natronorubrum sediminis]SEH12236.1 hypothetical protein SAMN04487967_0716 [Natronorubrum sediminis]
MIDRSRTQRPDSSPTNTDRGVSEVLGFILVFSIIFLSVGLLYTVGFQAMNDYQETEQLNNAERAMESLTDNFNDVLRYGGVNDRYGELTMREGTIAVDEGGTTVNIEVGDNGESIEERDNDLFNAYGEDGTIDLGEFSYTAHGDTIAYEGGGLVRADEDRSEWSTDLKQPQIRCEEGSAASITLASVTADDQSINPSDSTGVTMTEINRDTKVYDNDEVTVQVEDDTEYEAAWESMVGSNGFDNEDNSLEGTCEADGDIVITLVEVGFEY